MPNLRLEHKFSIGKLKVYQEAGTEEYYIKLGKKRTRSLSRLFKKKKRK